MEALIVLAILAAVAAVAVPAMRGPSPRLVVRSEAAELSDRIASARLVAITLGRAQLLDLTELTCEGEAEPAQIVVLADGIVRGSDLCLRHGTEALHLRPSLLTGRLIDVSGS